MSTLLIVEDEFDLAECLKEMFLDEGYSVRMATDGLDALAMLDEQVPDLVVTDMMMPLLNGLGLLHAMRSTPRLAHVPVVLMSAARPTVPDDPLMTFIGKPFNVDLLRELVARKTGRVASD
jgi:CheY-like chemotaxis protein